MKRRSRDAAVANMLVAIALIVSVGLACGLRKPWRDYTPRPFNSQQWRDGDAVTRGTMYADLFTSRQLGGQRREGVVALLGEPDKKTTTEGLEVWLYHVEVTGEWSHPYFPVSFRKDGGAFAGRVKDGTMSMIIDEGE
jgi:hypothetical protein